MSRFSLVTAGPKQILISVLGLLLLVTGLTLGSYQLDEKTLTGRRGSLAYIPRQYRQTFVEYRLELGLGTSVLLVLTGLGWAGTERLARIWQKQRNQELAAND